MVFLLSSLLGFYQLYHQYNNLANHYLLVKMILHLAWLKIVGLVVALILLTVGAILYLKLNVNPIQYARNNLLND